MDVFQAARIYIKSPDVCLFNIPSDRICLRPWRGCKMCHAYRDGGTIEKARTSAQFRECRARAREKFNRKETSWAYIYAQHTDTHSHTHSSSPRLTLPFMRVPFKGPMESSTRSVNKGPGALHRSSTRFRPMFNDSTRLSVALSAASTTLSLRPPYPYLRNPFLLFPPPHYPLNSV